MTNIETNYFGHDAEYQRRRSQGFPGWADQPTLDQNLKTLAAEFSQQAALLARMPGRSVLELGCGAGDLSIWLSERGFDVVGVDISPSAINWAKQKASANNAQTQFQICSVIDCAPLEDGRFDLVVDGHCLHCIIGEDRKTTLANTRRVLRPNGLLFVKTMCGDLFAPHIRMSDDLRQKFDNTTRCFMSSSGFATRYIGLPEDILEELSNAGFEVLSSTVEKASAVDAMDELRAWCRPT